MPKMTLYYIDKSYTIPFDVNHKVFPIEYGILNSQRFETIIWETVGNFGKTMDVPEIFLEVMKEEDFDRFIITVETNLSKIRFSIFLEVPKKQNILFAHHDDGSLYRLFAVNEDIAALAPLHKIPQANNTITHNHGELPQYFTSVA